MEKQQASQTSQEDELVQRVRDGFNEFFDWHMRGCIEYR
jgi:hypothetical protein